MNKFEQIVSGIYYTGAGAVLIVTAVRFIYKLARNVEQKDEFLEELRAVHLEHIYTALTTISEKLGVKLPPHPRP
jgi:hypothetical protein